MTATGLVSDRRTVPRTNGAGLVPSAAGGDGYVLAASGGASESSLERVIGSAGGLQRTLRRARMLAAVDTTVLLEGETGVGKDVLARAIHDSGPRRHGPFVAINCGGLSRELLASELFGYVEGAFTGARRSGMAGKVESADRGTLFLDEIAEMPLDLQPYLLRVLDDGEVCRVGGSKPCKVAFRLIAACNRDLRLEVAERRFRRDLFYRIAVVCLHIPPLRERREDLPALVRHFAEQVAQRTGAPARTFRSDVLVAFERYTWPGNVRELRNVVEAMSLLAEDDLVTTASLPEHLQLAPEPLPVSAGLADARGLEQVERDAIEAALLARQGNLTRAARDLKIARSTLYLKVARHGLEQVLDEARHPRASPRAEAARRP